MPASLTTALWLFHITSITPPRVCIPNTEVCARYHLVISAIGCIVYVCIVRNHGCYCWQAAVEWLWARVRLSQFRFLTKLRSLPALHLFLLHLQNRSLNALQHFIIFRTRRRYRRTWLSNLHMELHCCQSPDTCAPTRPNVILATHHRPNPINNPLVFYARTITIDPQEFCRTTTQLGHAAFVSPETQYIYVPFAYFFRRSLRGIT
jgi:hypothetical protein